MIYVLFVVIFIPSQTSQSIIESTFTDEESYGLDEDSSIIDETAALVDYPFNLGIDLNSQSVEIISEELLSPLQDRPYEIQNLIFPIVEMWKYSNMLEKGYLILGIPGDFVFGLTIPVSCHLKSEYQGQNSDFLISIFHLFIYPWIIFLIFPNFAFIGCILASGLLIFMILHILKLSKDTFMAFVGFISSCIWIYLLSNELVSLLKAFGIMFSVSDSLLGSTVFAWGNSLLDLLINIKIAQLVSLKFIIYRSFLLWL